MHSLSFLVVELETARTKLLDVFEAANGGPKWTWHNSFRMGRVAARMNRHAGT